MIHLDHAATSFPKQAPVLAAILHWYEHLGVSAERGDSGRCVQVRTAVDETRARLGALVGMPGQRVAFTSGATEALNLALRAVLRDGDSVVTTAFEHSSVVRPLLALQQQRRLRIEVIAPSPTGGLLTDEIAAAVASVRPRLLVFTHASNVTGAVFDAAAFCEIARRHGAWSLLDVSQTAGLFDLRVGSDLVAGSCHKALHGPPGLGFLAARDGLELLPQKQGGTGSSLALAEHPTTWPAAFEAGTPNTPAILGQLAALRWLERERPERLLAASLRLTAMLIELLANKPAVRVLHPPPGPRTPVLSFVHAHFDPAEIGSMLDSAGVAVRTGFHCAPWLHGHLGTSAAGTVRMSPGPGISADDIRAAAAAVAD